MHSNTHPAVLELVSILERFLAGQESEEAARSALKKLKALGNWTFTQNVIDFSGAMDGKPPYGDNPVYWMGRAVAEMRHALTRGEEANRATAD